MNEPFYLDELHAGQRFTSGTHTVDERQVTAFAREFDPQPFHVDAETAKGTLFGGLAASGWHTAAITMRLNVVGGLPIAGGIVGMSGEIAWPQPVRPGDVLHVESEVVEVTPSRSRPDRGVVTIRSETKNERGENGRDFFTGTFSLVDCEVIPFGAGLSDIDMGIPAKYPNLRRWLDRARARPSYRTAEVDSRFTAALLRETPTAAQRSA